MSFQTVKLAEGWTIPWKNQTGGSINVGAVVIVGARVGILVQGKLVGDTALANGDFGVVALQGVFDGPKLSTDHPVEGADYFWDVTNTRLTSNPLSTPAANIAPALVYAGMNARLEAADGVRGYVRLIEGVGNPIFNVAFPDQATNDITIKNPYPFPIRIIDALIENNAANGANANSLQVCAAAGGASTITDAMSLNAVAAKSLVRAAAVDPVNGLIAASTDFFVRQTKAGGTMGGIIRIFCSR